MGFGLLFLGYLFMYSFPYKGFDVTPDILGFLISYLGIRKLSEYGCGWDVLKKYMYVILPAGGVTAILQIIIFFGNDLGIYTYWSYAYTALLMVYNVLLLTAVYKIAEDTEVKSIKAKAKRNMILGIAYYFIMLFLDIPVAYVQNLKSYLSSVIPLGFIIFVFGYLWQFLNLAVIFSCYMWICAPGDEDMPVKESKFSKKKKEED